MIWPVRRLLAVTTVCASLSLSCFDGLSAEPKKAPQPAKPPSARSAAHIETVLAKDAGYVEFVHVEIGTPVREGELLVSLDTDRFRHSYEVSRIRAASKSAIAVASSEVRSKQSQHDTIKENIRFRRADRGQLLRAEAELDTAKAKLQLAVEADKLSELDFSRAEEQLEARFIRSPIAGVLVDIPRKRGDNVSPGMIVARVSDPSTVSVALQLTPETAADFETGGRIALKRVGSDAVDYARIQSIFAVPGDPNGMQQMNLVFDTPPDSQSGEYELMPNQGVSEQE